MLDYPEFHPDITSHEAYTASLQEYIAATDAVTQRRQVLGTVAVALLVGALIVALAHYLAHPRKAPLAATEHPDDLA